MLLGGAIKFLEDEFSCLPSSSPSSSTYKVLMARVIQPVLGRLRKLLARSKKCKSPDQKEDFNRIHPHHIMCFHSVLALTHADIIGVA